MDRPCSPKADVFWRHKEWQRELACRAVRRLVSRARQPGKPTIPRWGAPSSDSARAPGRWYSWMNAPWRSRRRGSPRIGVGACVGSPVAVVNQSVGPPPDADTCARLHACSSPTAFAMLRPAHGRARTIRESLRTNAASRSESSGGRGHAERRQLRQKQPTRAP
jgi:hypothetical protein